MFEYFGIFWFRQQVSKGFVFRKPENVPKIFAKMELPKQFFGSFFSSYFFTTWKFRQTAKLLPWLLMRMMISLLQLKGCPKKKKRSNQLKDFWVLMDQLPPWRLNWTGTCLGKATHVKSGRPGMVERSSTNVTPIVRSFQKIPVCHSFICFSWKVVLSLRKGCHTYEVFPGPCKCEQNCVPPREPEGSGHQVWF